MPDENDCTHLDTVQNVEPSSDGCEDCLKTGGTWIHLRMCQQCGHVGCCSESPNYHSLVHFKDTGHPLMRSFEPGEDWFWCFVDEVGFRLDDAPPAPSHS